MSKFKDMLDAAQASQKDWFEYSERCKRAIAKLMIDFINYCEIPHENTSYLRFDEGTQQYLPAADGYGYSVSGATTYDEDQRCWRIGLSVNFMDEGYAGFGITLSESKDGKFLVTLPGEQSQRQIDVNDKSQCNSFYDDLVTTIVKSYRDDRRPPGRRTIGFSN